ncbi:sugar ABC transporter ATP-binding protein [Criibacterium bergeronii]|uniref:Sugar ABC transporter ATP-binding protein n=1 Tax=Criibacterium bergeronii TaxID=1871336 RepID=A0A371IIX0_9FIRM|nr:sugar ABC transporter ATP-binding protein [Criibacterium bergeronii]RDY20420.1 sugar ABC transporter ATP-binding protein [Criibacterium bergeronii]TRW28322.1 sugar ABC transporter ATP-binding protein [Criibacterium bergeronii]
MDNVLLEAKSVGKSFDGNVVLKDVSFQLGAGKILGLVGENGAGKSTLMNIIFGMSVIAETGGYDGELLLNGEKLNFKSPLDALNAGIGMVHQEFNLIPGFTVSENITLNMEKTNPSVISRILGKKLETINEKENLTISGNSLDTLGVKINPRDITQDMPVGHKQFIEIAREMTRDNVKLLIMDEPTAVLTESEADILIAALRKIASMGISVIFISHRLREVLSVCDDIVILRDGVLVESKKASEMTIEEMAAKMVGRAKEDKAHKIENAATEAANLANLAAKHDEQKADETILEIKNLWVDMPGEQVVDVNLEVKKGEILGLAGLAGQGKLGIPNGILGTYPVGGSVTFKGEDLKLGDTFDILKRGISFVSEDRRGVGLLLDEPIYWNIAFNALNVQNKFTKKIMGINFRDETAMKALADEYIDVLAIKTTGSNQKAQNLSGGNQQKVCLAKAFAMEPEVLFVSEPTRGIDIGAKQLVLNAIKKSNIENNTTVIMASSELEELRSICDRIAVICDGKVAGILSPDDSEAKFGLLMSGEKLEQEVM